MLATNISNLKQHLSENLRKVKEGKTITIVERDTPIAKIVPLKKATQHTLTVKKPSVVFIDMKLKIQLSVKPDDYLNREDTWFTT